MERTGIRSRLVYIAPEHLQQAWPRIISGLLKVQEHSESHWIPEDVYACLKSGRATLHLTEVDGQSCGFVILEPVQNYDGKELHLWCVYNDSQHDVFSIFTPEIDKMGRAIGAKRLTFWSPRKWDKKVKPLGFEPRQTIFTKELL